METRPTSRRTGGALAIVAAALIAAQPPFCAPAARQFRMVQFVFWTQVGLLAALPLLLIGQDSRRDFLHVLGAASNYGKLAAIVAIGAAGLLLYNVSLSREHPVVVVAILNLSPFWAALVARIATKTPIPISPLVFFACLAVAGLGAIAVAWSQAGDHAGLVAELMRGTWLFAIPIPLFTALSGTLTSKWFGDLNASGVVAANVLVGAVVLIPATLLVMRALGEPVLAGVEPTLLMIVGIILADAIGRVFTQKALNATGNDNGFVTMFQNLEPAIAALLSFGLSPWIEGLGFAANGAFFAGLALTGAGLLVFSRASIRQEARTQDPEAGATQAALASRLDR